MATAKSKPKAKKPAAKKSAGKKSVAKPTPAVKRAANGQRKLKEGEYKSFKLSKRIKHPMRLPSVWRLTGQTAVLLWRHKWLFLGITLIYGIFNLIFVQGLSAGTDVSSLKSALQDALGGSSFSASLSVFTVLLGSAGSGNTAAAGGYQFFLVIIVSLAVIWALREVMLGARIRVRDAYYRGMYPLIPFILVLAVIALQLIPLAAGASIYNIVLSNGIAVFAAEKVLWGLLFALTALLSLYMISSSIFALYIVTLPDMTPLRALRTARQLVRHRRWTVLRKVFVLPVILLIVAGLIMLPIILLVAPIAQWMFYLLTMAAVVVMHAYLYGLYRELLHE